MKQTISQIFLVLWAVGLTASCNAQDKKPQTWEEKKADKLQPAGPEDAAKIAKAVPSKATVTPKKTRRMLVFWRCEGFIHTSIVQGNEALKQMGEKTGAYQADFADDYSVFSVDNLKQYDVIFFNNTTHLKPDDEQKAAILDFLAQGKGIAGAHAAGDNFGGWAEGVSMIGGIFDGHPWNAKGTWAFRLDDPAHPLNAAFEGKGFWHTDEIYQYKSESFRGPSKMRLLNSLDMRQKEVSKQIKDGPRDVAVTWIQEYKGGRVFYSNFGHRGDTFMKAPILKMFLDGIQYAAGDLEADAAPTATLQSVVPAYAPDRKAAIEVAE